MTNNDRRINRHVGAQITVTLVMLLSLVAGSAHADDNDYCRQHWETVGGCFHRVERPRWRPVLTAAAELGASHFNEGGPGSFSDGFGSVTKPGGVWGARIGIDFFSWLGLEARYLGMSNGVHNGLGGGLDYTTSAGIFDVRIGAPIPYVHPYVFAGIGVYNMHLSGSGSERAASMLNSSTQAGVPTGVGVDVPLNWHLSVGVEAAYHFQLNESYAHTTVNGIDGGDFSTVTGVFRIRI